MVMVMILVVGVVIIIGVIVHQSCSKSAAIVTGDHTYDTVGNGRPPQLPQQNHIIQLSENACYEKSSLEIPLKENAACSQMKVKPATAVNENSADDDGAYELI